MEPAAPSFADPQDPLFKRVLIRGMENLLGRRRLVPIYECWRRESAGCSRTMWSGLLARIEVRLAIDAGEHWAKGLPETPLVMIANHPFGIADGIALLALAEHLRRPYRILLNAGFMRVPEMRNLGLPIDFSESEDALATNLRTRAEARRLLKEGVVILIFPGGGVATAANPFGRAEELPWKLFAARLIQQSEAAVLPIYFEGQNSALFHFVSRHSLTLRLGLLVNEFRRLMGSEIRVHVGTPVTRTEIASIRNTSLLNEELYVRVQRLAPGASAAPREALLPRPTGERRRDPWETPARASLSETLRTVSPP